MMNTQATEEDWVDSKGRKVPAALVSDSDKLKEQTINKVLAYGTELSEQIGRFRSHTFDDVNALVSLLAEKYDAKLGGAKGNVELVSYDGTRKVQVSVADHITFGPELQAAKELIEQCIEDWSEGSNDNIRALVSHAFDTEQTGKINREALFSLRRLEIDDARWQEAMKAITDSIQIVGSKSYVRLYKRETPQDRWEIIPLNVAAV